MNIPKFLFLHVGTECNLTCKHCHYWMSDTKHDPERISVKTMEEIVKEFSTLNPNGKVVICGGEPMLEYERYIGVCQAVRACGLRVFNASNGYGIHSDARAADLLLRGPHEFTISLDSHLPTVHDEIRGRVGSYDTAIKAVQRLVRGRELLELKTKSLNEGSKIYVMVLLTTATYDHLRELYRLVLRDLEADKLKVNGLQPSFGIHAGPPPADDFFASYSQLDVPRLREELIYCNSEFNLSLNPAWIDQICHYYEDLQGHPNMALGWNANLGTTEHICNCYERNLVVGLYGEIGHCYNFTAFPPIKYRAVGDLTNFWNDNQQREAMSSCNRLCAVGHSNRNVSATSDEVDP